MNIFCFSRHLSVNLFWSEKYSFVNRDKNTKEALKMLSFDTLLKNEKERGLRKGKDATKGSDNITDSIFRILTSDASEEEAAKSDNKVVATEESPLQTALMSPNVIEQWLYEALQLDKAPAIAAIKRLLSIPSLLANAFEGNGMRYLKGIPLPAGIEVGSPAAYYLWVARSWEAIVARKTHSDLSPFNVAQCFIELVKNVLPHNRSGNNRALPLLIHSFDRTGPPLLLVECVINLLHHEGRQSILLQWLHAWLKECPSGASNSLVGVIPKLSKGASSDTDEDDPMGRGPLETLVDALCQLSTSSSAPLAWPVVLKMLRSLPTIQAPDRHLILSVFQRHFVSPLAKLWASEETVHNLSLDDGVTYTLMSLMATVPFDGKGEERGRLGEVMFSFDTPTDILSESTLSLPMAFVFEGINSHFSATSDSARKRGAIVAVAYTSLAVAVRKDMKEPIEPMHFEAYPNCLEEWVAANVKRSDAVGIFIPLTNPHAGGIFTAAPTNAKGSPGAAKSAPKLGLVPVTHLLTYPLDPSQRITLRGPFRVTKNNDSTTASGSAAAPPQPFMKPFGKTSFNEVPKQSSDGQVPFVRSVHDGLRLLCGIGSKPNESERDRAVATEAALKALPSLLRSMLDASGDNRTDTLTHQRLSMNSPKSIGDQPSLLLLRGSNEGGLIGRSRDRDEQSTFERKGDAMAAAESALGPMASLAINALVCCDVVFPTSIQAQIDQLRLEVLTLLMAMAPLVSLQQLSVMLFHSNYSVSQRVMLHHGLQGAIRLWAAVPDGSSLGLPTLPQSEATSAPRKRIYPPIADDDEEHANTMRTAREAIAARVEQKTRRWGSTVKGRNNPVSKASPGTRNKVSHYADAVITAVLEYYDHKERAGGSESAKSLHTFSFLAEADMLYCPAELLATIRVLFEHYHSPAGGVILLATRTLPFLKEAIRHPHTIVRAQAWMTLVQVVTQFASAVHTTQEPAAVKLLELTLQQLLPAASQLTNSSINGESPLCRAAAAEFVNMSLGLMSA